MTRTKVKMFNNKSVQDLEKCINYFIEQHEDNRNITIRDIKIDAFDGGNEWCFVGIIIYKEFTKSDFKGETNE